MIVLVIFCVIAAVLFAGAFLSKRRFGLLGLALTAGATLSITWNYYAGLLVASTGLVPEGPITQAATQSLVVLLPAILLLFHGYTYKNKLSRVVGSLFFTVLALAFLIEPIGFALSLEGANLGVYNWFVGNKELIISVGVVLAVVDLFFTKPAKLADKDSKKK